MEKPIFSSEMCPKDNLRDPVVFSEIIFYIYTQFSSPLWIKKN